MTQVSPQVSLNGSRLVRFLSELDVSESETAEVQFSERLAGLISFSDSIKLWSIHEELPAMAFDAIVETSAEGIKSEFINTRTAIVQSVIRGFSQGAGVSRLKLPVPTSDTVIEELADFEPYKRFYTALQKEMDYKVQVLQANVRDGASSLSLALTQLATLDAALGDTLALHSRKMFALIPSLLEKRFKHLLAEYQQSLSEKNPEEEDLSLCFQTGGWLAQFHREIQGLLLAELEIRLQPILGLIEAIDEEDIVHP